MKKVLSIVAIIFCATAVCMDSDPDDIRRFVHNHIPSLYTFAASKLPIKGYGPDIRPGARSSSSIPALQAKETLYCLINRAIEKHGKDRNIEGFILSGVDHFCELYPCRNYSSPDKFGFHTITRRKLNKYFLAYHSSSDMSCLLDHLDDACNDFMFFDIAAKTGHVHYLQKKIAAGAISQEQKDELLYTALISRQDACVNILLQCGANREQLDKFRRRGRSDAFSDVILEDNKLELIDCIKDKWALDSLFEKSLAAGNLIVARELFNRGAYFRLAYLSEAESFRKEALQKEQFGVVRFIDECLEKRPLG